MPTHRSAAIGFLVLALALPASNVRTAAAAASSVTLEWTSPGDDGRTGTALAYDIRFSRDPITAANFNSAFSLTNLIVPGPAGTRETFTVFGLTAGILYYFAVKTVDEAGNWSAISNVVSYPGSTVNSEKGWFAPEFSSPWPNPARSETRFSLSLPQDDFVRVEAFDVGGRVIRTLARGTYAGGTVDLVWNLRDEAGRPVRPGTYLIRGQIGSNVFLRRVSIVH